MKKIIIATVILLAVFTITVPRAEAAEPAAAALLSAVLPGTGEWYNAGFQGSYPFAECIVGCICPLVQFSSMFDAVQGNTDQNTMRLDFWTAPK